MSPMKCVVLFAAPLLFIAVFAQDTPPTSPPAPKPPMLRVSSGVAEGNLIHRVNPVYPPQAKSRNLSGDVSLEAVIDREGRVTQLVAVSGSPLFAKAAMDAVRKWKYRPWMLKGEPVEVKTTIIVHFRMR